MTAFSAGYRSLSLLLNLSLDRVFSLAAIAMSLLAAGFLASRLSGF